MSPEEMAELIESARPLTLADLRAMTPEARALVPCTGCAGNLEGSARSFLCSACRREWARYRTIAQYAAERYATLMSGPSRWSHV